MVSSAICVGSTVDSVALSLSYISRFLQDKRLPKGFLIAADEAYHSIEFVVALIPRSMANRYQDGSNFCFSSHRVHVEQALGRKHGKWGLLWRPLQFNIQTYLIIVNTAMRMENHCINGGDA